MSDFERVRESSSLQEFVEAHLEHVRGGYVCPNCNSGKGPKGTPALKIYRESGKWYCHACQTGGDIFDMAGYIHDTQDRREQLRIVADWAGIALEGNSGGYKQPQAARRKQAAPDYTQGRIEEAAKVAQYQADLWKYPEAVSYLTGRGFTEEEIRRFGFGAYQTSRETRTGWRDGAGQWVNGVRVVVPWKGAPWYHNDRAVADDVTERKYLFPSSEKVGAKPFYNPDATKEAVFFIAEGPMDALAIEACGYPAMALGTRTMSKRKAEELAALVTSRGGEGYAVIFADNDENGQGFDGARALGEYLDAAGVRNCVLVSEEGDPKDACAWLEAGRREELAAHLEEARNKGLRDTWADKEERYREALRSLRVFDPSIVAGGIYSLSEVVEPMPTGIRSLDGVLGGGLQPGLYALGAVSSLGKTTLSVQIADTLAETGHTVLFVTIEQSAREIVSKSISRLVRTESGRTITPQEMTNPNRRGMWGELQETSFLSALDAYSARIAPNLRILEGTKQPSVTDVRAVASMMAEHDGRAPVVMIDYLQLLAAPGERDTDKQATDKNVMALRQMARDLKTPVWVISSLNRASYSEGVTLDAWKESGAIEYGSDVLLGLQPRGMAEKLDDAKESRQKREAAKILRENKAGFVRECELVVLKNRNGQTPAEGVPLIFEPLASLFLEAEGEPEQAEKHRRVI